MTFDPTWVKDVCKGKTFASMYVYFILLNLIGNMTMSENVDFI